jgi:hypothetical protein
VNTPKQERLRDGKSHPIQEREPDLMLDVEFDDATEAERLEFTAWRFPERQRE